MEAAYGTTVDKAGGGSQKSTSQATVVRTLAKLNHVATDSLSNCRAKFTCSNISGPPGVRIKLQSLIRGIPEMIS